MLLIYIIGTRLYFLAIRIASAFNLKAKLLIKGQKKWKSNLKDLIIPNENYIWIHCASLGEFEQGRPLIEKLKSEPLTQTYKIILTFFSPSGYEVRRNYDHADIVFYLPFDKRKNAQEFLNIVNPLFAIFVKYEFWYFYLSALKSKNISSYLISAIFRDKQIFFKSYGKFFLKSIKSFTHIFVQDQNSLRLLDTKKITNCDVCGDTRTDRVLEIAKEDYKNDILKKFTKNKNTIVCGSTWPEDEKLISKFVNNSNDTYRFIIAPHEIDDKHITLIEKQLSCNYIRYSEITSEISGEVKLIIIDSIGLLSKLYRFGQIAYIGGGFGKGIHNILEAAVYKIPIIFGPNYKKFKEANDLIKIESAFCVKTTAALICIINRLVSDFDMVVEIRKAINGYINQSSGSTQYIFNKLHNIGEF